MNSKSNSNYNIKCDVASCDFNNCEEGTCQLEKVHIGCSCDNDKCYDMNETICQSFKDTHSSNSNITDTVYEVTAES